MNKQFVIHYMHILFEKICHGFLAENLKYFVFIILHIYVCVCNDVKNRMCCGFGYETVCM